MKLIRIGSSGEQVKILQALLGYIKTDGVYTLAFENHVKRYQSSKGLEPDGVCGNKTWASLFYLPSSDYRLYVQKIPFSRILDIDVLLHDKDKTYSVNRFAKEFCADICINGAMFDMNTYQNVTDLVIDGVVNNGGNYSNKGIAFYGTGAYASTTFDSKGKPVDFIGGAPILIQNGIKNLDMHGLSVAYYNAITQRIAIGCDDANIFIITTGRQYKCNLDTILTEGLIQRVKTLINLDGGGSTAQSIKCKTVFTGGRNVPSAIAIKVKW